MEILAVYLVVGIAVVVSTFVGIKALRRGLGEAWSVSPKLTTLKLVTVLAIWPLLLYGIIHDRKMLFRKDPS